MAVDYCLQGEIHGTSDSNAGIKKKVRIAAVRVNDRRYADRKLPRSKGGGGVAYLAGGKTDEREDKRAYRSYSHE
jgi:hypothetical protein